MERRTIVIIVAVAVGAIGYLIFRDSEPKSTPTPPDSPAAVAKDQTVSITGGEGEHAYTAVVSTSGGGLKHVLLASKQYHQKDRLNSLSEPSKLKVSEGKIDPAKFKEGPYDVVGTWSPSFYPFTLEATTLGWTRSKTNSIEREVRALTSVTADGKDPRLLTLAAPVAGDLRVLIGDRVVGEAGEEQAVADVRGETAVVTEKAMTSKRVRVVRRGSPSEQYGKDSTYVPVASSPGGVTLVWPNPARDTSEVFIERTWKTAGDFKLKQEVRVVNLGRDALEARLRMAVHGWEDPWAEPPGMFTPPVSHWAPTCFVGGSVVEKTAADVREEEGQQVVNTGLTRWFGTNSQYFLIAALFESDEGVQGICRLRAQGNGVITSSFERETSDFVQGSVAACLPEWYPAARRGGLPTCSEAMKRLGVDPAHLDAASLDRALDSFKGPKDEAVTLRAMVESYGVQSASPVLSLAVFAGPKDLNLLQAADPTLEKNLDFWVLGFLSKPMLWLLKALYGVFPYWWLAIFLLTVVVRLLMLPLTHRQAVSMQKMQNLKPELEELQKKYGADKQRQQQEMLNLYKRAGVNPLGGCLPILLQMPVYIALYRCIYSAVDLFQAPLFGWVHDMTQPDPYYILPVLLGIFMVVQQQFMPQAAGADPMQQKIMQYVMPAMFSVFMLVLPAGLVFYIFVSTVIGVGQSYWIKRKFGGPPAGARGRS